jgi:1-phosphatidylinositol-4,5-bisphosphate phosphodiesterase classes I and II
LEISSIRDTRTGRYARIPRDGKLKESINIGPADVTLEDKTLTIAYGQDFVNINFINFVCNSKEDAQLWTDQLLEMAYNPLALNSSLNTLLAKAHSKIQLMTDKDGKILSKNIVKIFARHPDDKKRVEKALEESGLPCSKNYSISPDKFTFEVFFTFYKNLVVRSEIDEIFDKL